MWYVRCCSMGLSVMTMCEKGGHQFQLSLSSQSSHLCCAELVPEATLRGRLGGTLRRVSLRVEAVFLDGTGVGFFCRRMRAPTAAAMPTPASTTPAMTPLFEVSLLALDATGLGEGLLERVRLTGAKSICSSSEKLISA